MGTFFKFIFFLVALNVVVFMFPALGFFPDTVQGDSDKYNLSEENIPSSPEDLFNRLITDSNNVAAAPFGVPLTFSEIMVGLAVIGVGVSWLAHSTTPIAMALLGILATMLYSNSKKITDIIFGNLGKPVQYIGLAIGVLILILIVILLMDYASGQRQSEED